MDQGTCSEVSNSCDGCNCKPTYCIQNGTCNHCNDIVCNDFKETLSKTFGQTNIEICALRFATQCIRAGGMIAPLVLSFLVVPLLIRKWNILLE